MSDNLNGWKSIASANSNDVIDIVDVRGDRWTDCWYEPVLWHDENNAIQYKHYWCHASDDGYGNPEVVVSPVYWMKVVLPNEQQAVMPIKAFDGMKN